MYLPPSVLRDAPSASIPPSRSRRAPDQGRQILVEDGPQDVEIDYIIPMNQPVTEGHRLAPRHLGIPPAEILRHACGRFPNDFHQAHPEPGSTAGRCPDRHGTCPGPSGGLRAWSSIWRRSPADHGDSYSTSASANASSRKYGLRQAGVFRSTLRPSRSDNSSCIEKKSSPGVCPGSNSTSTSTSLWGPKCADDRAEQRQSPNVVPPAERGNAFPRDLDLHAHVGSSANIRLLNTPSSVRAGGASYLHLSYVWVVYAMETASCKGKSRSA